MKPTFWLASYPKSGNTWFRILVANLARKDGDPPVDINAIENGGGMASSRAPFDNHMMVESSMLDFEAIDLLRPRLYAHLAAREVDATEARSPARLVTTHDGYTTTALGEPLMAGAAGAKGALLFIRDPRDVASSLANHLACSVDQAIDHMGDPDYCFCDSRTAQTEQLRQRLLGWSGFAASWLDQRNIPVHLVRYEDLHDRPHETLRTALAFAEWNAGPDAIDRAIAAASIDQLQHQEAARGFREAPRHGRRFFRRGQAGGWRDELTASQVARIELDHWPAMQRLGYARQAEDRDEASAETVQRGMQHS